MFMQQIWGKSEKYKSQIQIILLPGIGSHIKKGKNTI